MPNAPAFMANGNINPSCFVKIDPTATSPGMKVIQAAAATDKLVGISQVGTRQAPGVTGSDGYAAHQGEPIQVYGAGEVCLLKVGAGAIVAGDWLTSDANGNGVKVTDTGTTGTLIIGAEALESANAGELVRVVVRISQTQFTS